MIISEILYDLDLVHIRDFSKTKFYFFYKTKVNEIKDHLIYPQKTNFKKQAILKNKLIKTDLYKTVIYHLWPIIMNYQMIFHAGDFSKEI